MPQWFDYLGGPPIESHKISQNNTIHILEGGVLKNGKGDYLPSNYVLLREALNEDIPEYVMKRIEHFIAQKMGDAKAERIRKAAEAAMAAEREAIQKEELEERRAKQAADEARANKATKTASKKLQEPEEDDFEEEDDEDEDDEEDIDFEALEKDLTGPSKKKVTSKKKKK